MSKIRTEWHAMKEKWFHGETVDPVFEGVVRDFCVFDEAMHGVQSNVEAFMKGVEQFCTGLITLSEGVSGTLAHAEDHLIASDSCKLKEAANTIARSDAPHSAISKLRRDMIFNILNPVQAHITNNRNLKVSLDIRRRRLAEYTSAKKQFEECQKKGIAHTEKRYLNAQSNFEAAKTTFTEVDRHVFEWLYILEEYRGDILDSTLQTVKYLEYEFFATASHAISSSLPSRMEFRPMVEMTPDHLEPQVEMELQEQDELEIEAPDGGPGAVADFSLRLIEKKAKEDPDEHAVPAAPVCPLSLSALLSQGFEEGPARKALRMHNNDTQAALDWLVDGGTEEAVAAKKAKAVEEGVRMPTTVKRVQKLKAMRRKQQEKKKSVDENEEGSSKKSSEKDDKDKKDKTSDDRKVETKSEREEPPKKKEAPAPVQDLLETNEPSASSKAAAPVQDLLGFDSEEPAVPTDFSKPVEMQPLPQMDLLYDGGARCEKPPLPTSVAAGTAPARSPKAADGLMGLAPFGDLPAAAAPSQGTASSATAQALAGFSPEVLAQAAKLVAAQSAAAAAPPQQTPAPAAGPPDLAALYSQSSAGAAQPAAASGTAPAAASAPPDPFAGLTAGNDEAAPASPTSPEDMRAARLARLGGGGGYAGGPAGTDSKPANQNPDPFAGLLQ